MKKQTFEVQSRVQEEDHNFFEQLTYDQFLQHAYYSSETKMVLLE